MSAKTRNLKIEAVGDFASYRLDENLVGWRNPATAKVK